jgi:hypothetical protein
LIKGQDRAKERYEDKIGVHSKFIKIDENIQQTRDRYREKNREFRTKESQVK